MSRTRLSTTVDSDLAESKNGRLTVDTLSSAVPSNQTFTNLATCPNRNWSKAVQQGSIDLTGFTYTVTFGEITGNTFTAAFPGAYITITGS